jgi:hypothetical protein
MTSLEVHSVCSLIESTAALGILTQSPSMMRALRNLEDICLKKSLPACRIDRSCKTRWGVALQLAHTWDEPSKTLGGNLCALSHLSEQIDDDELVCATDDLVEAFLKLSERMSYCRFGLRAPF